ncbi:MULTISPECIES: hypothetical protein [unclassified Bradyrhizobium]
MNGLTSCKWCSKPEHISEDCPITDTLLLAEIDLRLLSGSTQGGRIDLERCLARTMSAAGIVTNMS